MSIQDRVFEYIQQNRMMINGDRVIVGVSGGADSMCLLFLLCELRQRLGIMVSALHVHHGIRGKGADRDAAFVEEYCRNHDIEYILERIDVPKEAQRTHETIEEAARRMRYECLLKRAACMEAKIAIAHHQEDQAETVLHNMLRGSSLKGLGGIRAVREQEGIMIIRPMLCLSRAEIEECLRLKGIEYVTDETNLQLEYTRNKIRNMILPLAKEINQGAIRHIVRLAEDISEADEILCELSDDCAKKYISGENDIRISEALLMEKSLLQRRVIRIAYERSSGRLKDITAEHIAAIQHLLAESQTGREISLPYNIKATKEYGEVVLKKIVQSDESAGQFLSSFRTSLRIIETDSQEYPKEMYTKWFDCDNIKKVLQFRTRQSGDYIVISGGRQKLQDFFVKQKVPRDERDSVLLLTEEGSSEVIWAVSKSISRINERYKVKPGQTRVIEANVEF